MGRAGPFANAVEAHLERILRDFTTFNERRTRPRVVVDCGGGAGSTITPYLLQRLGCEVLALNSHPTGFFPRGIEPTPENLRNLASAVTASGASVGLAHDADADRLAVIDDLGRFAAGDKVMVLLSQEIGAKALVTTVDTSMAVEGQGFQVIRTRVGDPYVGEQLKSTGDFGAEPAGAYIFPGVSLCPDAIYAAALAIKVSARGRLSEQLDDIPEYPMNRGSVPGEASLMLEVEASLASLPEAAVSREDGLRLGFSDGWLLVRPSGTEPKIRITAEARTEARAAELYRAAESAIMRCATAGKGVVG